MWRGPALQDSGRGPICATEADRLEEKRSASSRDRRCAAGGRASTRPPVCPSRPRSSCPPRRGPWQRRRRSAWRRDRPAAAAHRRTGPGAGGAGTALRRPEVPAAGDGMGRRPDDRCRRPCARRRRSHGGSESRGRPSAAPAQQTGAQRHSAAEPRRQHQVVDGSPARQASSSASGIEAARCLPGLAQTRCAGPGTGARRERNVRRRAHGRRRRARGRAA
ncbi:hypothetical protein ACF1BU_37130 [Streptomyces sp. NPDC014724]|uniref:hypothetical protein n=1 Tax=Streptomyces sp. NPDC014724 TaxID=3364882 RepID=UPI0036FF1F5C